MEYFTFGPLLQRARTRYLGKLNHCRKALVLGDGDGRFTAALLRSNPLVRVHAVDSSAEMLRVLMSSAGEHGNRVTTEVADLRVWQPAQGAVYNLVATHFFLDCLTTDEILRLSSALTPALSGCGLWIVSDFAVPPGGFGKLFARPLVSGLYLAFRCLTGLGVRQLPDHRSVFTAAGWALLCEDQQLFGLLVSELWHRPDTDTPHR